MHGIRFLFFLSHACWFNSLLMRKSVLKFLSHLVVTQLHVPVPKRPQTFFSRSSKTKQKSNVIFKMRFCWTHCSKTSVKILEEFLSFKYFKMLDLFYLNLFCVHASCVVVNRETISYLDKCAKWSKSSVALKKQQQTNHGKLDQSPLQHCFLVHL